MVSPRFAAQTAIVEPPSSAAEFGLLLRFALPILCAAGLWLTYTRHSTAQEGLLLDGAGAALVAFAELPPTEQRLLRQIQEGVLEAENARSDTGAWPTVAALAEAEIPPFAADPLDPLGYAWRKLQRGSVVNYFGHPREESSRATFLVVFVEPPPGQVPDPRAVPDEVHHRLGDGTLVHVTVWIGSARATVTEALTFLPNELGWRRVSFRP